MLIAPKPTTAAAPKPQAKSTPSTSSAAKSVQTVAAPKTTSAATPTIAKASASIAASVHHDSFTAAVAGRSVAMKLGGTTTVQQAGTTGSDTTIDNVVDALKSGKTDDATRTMIAGFFEKMGMAEANAAMQRIRDEGLLGQFIDATARDDSGNPVAQEAKDGLVRLMETGRLDIYAHTLATVPINVGNYGHLAFVTPPPRMELDSAQLAGVKTDYGEDGVAGVLAHELFHAFANDHGGSRSAINEGFGIGASRYALTDDPYSLAETVYGTYKNYTEINGETTYPMGDWTGADAQLLELVNAISSRDSSQLAWNNPTQLQSEFDTFFAPLNRNQPFNDWLTDANQATADMLAARTATPTAAPPTATPTATPTETPTVAPNPTPKATATPTATPPAPNPLQQFWDWLTGLFGG